MDGSLAGSRHERLFNSSMLVTEGYLQMKNFFTMTLETEMARLDDSRVHGAYRDFVNLFPGHREEISNARFWRRRQTVPGPIWCVKSNRLQPRMPLRMNQPLLGDFTFEPMGLRAFQREAGVRLFHDCPEDGDAIRRRVSHNGNQLNVLILGGHPEQRRQ
ncbi:MAG: hypothetical protein ABSC63_06135 [Candidatus Binataceae bacterium]